jgi:hypothetical protein
VIGGVTCLRKPLQTTMKGLRYCLCNYRSETESHERTIGRNRLSLQSGDVPRSKKERTLRNSKLQKTIRLKWGDPEMLMGVTLLIFFLVAAFRFLFR